MQQRRQIGFTLIELMVTIAVAAVLVGLAVPGFRDLIDKSRLRGATDDLVNLLNASRASAVKLGLDVNASAKIASATSWCVGAVSATDPEAATGTVGTPAAAAAACDCTSSTACTISGLGNLAAQKLVVSSTTYAGVQLSSLSGGLNSNTGLTFNAKFGALDFGALAGLKPLVVTSASGKYKTQITVSALGQTHVCTPSSSGFVSGYPSC